VTAVAWRAERKAGGIMDIEARLAALEARVRGAEDQLEIIRLLNSYGPLVDSGESQAAAHLWINGGTYNVGGIGPKKAYEDLVDIYDGQGHRDLINGGAAHLTATPRVTVTGDTAEAVAYSFVVQKSGEGWRFFRAAANHWTLVRTAEGWRIAERYNRVLDGSTECQDTLRRALR
jgi:hypothetical protein